MSRYIDADALLDILRGEEEYNADIHERADGIRDAIMDVLEAPTADVVGRKKGEWVKVKGSDGKDYRKCSNCLHTQEITGILNFCPICGADMRGVK